MGLADREEFERRLALLCAGYNVPMMDHRSDAYFLGLIRMSLPKFASCVEFALSEKGPEKFPSVHAMWVIYRKLAAGGGQASPAAGTEPKPHQDDLLCFANRLMLRHIISRGGIGPTELQGCRALLLGLVDDFSRSIQESDDMATPANFMTMLGKGMQKISPMEDATRSAWRRLIKLPAGQKPFPPEMAKIRDSRAAVA